MITNKYLLISLICLTTTSVIAMDDGGDSGLHINQPDDSRNHISIKKAIKQKDSKSFIPKSKTDRSSQDQGQQSSNIRSAGIHLDPHKYSKPSSHGPKPAAKLTTHFFRVFAQNILKLLNVYGVRMQKIPGRIMSQQALKAQLKKLKKEDQATLIKNILDHVIAHSKQRDLSKNIEITLQKLEDLLPSNRHIVISTKDTFSSPKITVVDNDSFKKLKANKTTHYTIQDMHDILLAHEQSKQLTMLFE